MSEQKGLRYNSNKPRFSLVSPVAMDMLIKVLEFGATKYDKHNWAKGMEWEAQTLDSMMRHIQAWRTGEDNDPETGLPHVAHILCNAMFLAHFVGTKTGVDDRYFKEEKKECKNERRLPPEEMYQWDPARRCLVKVYRGPVLATSPTNEPTQGS